MQSLEAVVRRVVTPIARGQYAAAVAECHSSRLTADDIRDETLSYGRTFIEPPPDAYRDLDVVGVREAAVPTWSVRVPLWTEEEGESDLTLELTIAQREDDWQIALDGLHVL